MGREVRMVPPGWEHPKDKRGSLIPLLRQTRNEYVAEKAAWERKDMAALPSYVLPRFLDEYTYEEWAGTINKGPRMPDFEPGTATHFRMYETCSEGAPISPAFATAEELARWLADNGASAMGSRHALYEEWLRMIRVGTACSGVMSGGRVISGVEALGREAS